MSEDLIRRSDAIKAVQRTDVGGIRLEDVCAVTDAVTDAINAIPTIEPKTKVVVQVTFDEEKLREIVKEAVERFKEEYEITDRPQGEWIGEADGYYNGELIYDIWYCSNCDYVVDDEEPPTWNFCPNCGCAMTKE